MSESRQSDVEAVEKLRAIVLNGNIVVTQQKIFFLLLYFFVLPGCQASKKLANSTIDYASSTLPPPTFIESDAFQAGDYFAPLLALRDQEPEYLASFQRLDFLQAIGTYESYVGNYAKAYKYFAQFEKELGIGNDRTQPTPDFAAVDAIPEIILAANGKQVVFINEAHHMPAHRALTTRLLESFWNEGFRYFSAETLDQRDSQINNRKFPLFGKTGWYTNEPFYGDLIREALRIGFTVVPYEFSESCTVAADEDRNRCQNIREQGQARNLYERILKDNPKAKILVHAGYGHIDKAGSGTWIPMARYFRELTSIEPYSIDQTSKLPINLDKPTVYKSKDGRHWVDPHLKNSYDLHVFHPTEIEHAERPEWTKLDNKRTAWSIDTTLCKNTFPCLVQAFLEHEDTQAVPIDQVEIDTLGQKSNLMLRQGHYTIRTISRGNKELAKVIVDQ
jgi:hypothetical protein